MLRTKPIMNNRKLIKLLPHGVPEYCFDKDGCDSITKETKK